MDLKQEMSNLIKVSFYTYVSLGYCFYVSKIVPKGVTRFIAILPVIIIFLFIPLFLPSVHAIGAVSFLISWLANFKLILFTFEKGPLSAPLIPLVRFFALACFPIHITQSNKKFLKPKSSKNILLKYLTKGLLLALFLCIQHDHQELMNPIITWIFYAFSIYLMLELLVTLSATIIALVLRVEVDPQFDEPYLATSLHDFWGRRWNVMVNRILHPTIYDPMLKRSTRVMGRFWAPIPAILATFAVSGLMHELIFFYFRRAWPTWEVMLFFCLHGVCLVMEIVIKKVINVKWSLPRPIASTLVVTFVLVTSYLLFRPELERCKMVDRAFEEYQAVGELARNIFQTTTSSLNLYD